MSQLLRQSTVAVINFGPMLDKTDGVTLEVAAGIITSLDHATTGIMLSKNGGALTIREQGGNFVATTYDAHGCFKVSLSAVDTGTLGRLRAIHTEPATYLAEWRDFMVIPATLWDTIFVAQPAAAIKKFFDVATPTGTVNSLPDAVPDAAGGLPISDAGGLDIDAKLANTNEVTAARMGALTDLIDGGRLDLILDAVLLDTGTTLQGELDAIEAAVITNAAGADIAADIIALKAETVEILTDTAVIGALGAGLTALATQASVDTIDGIVDSILVDTGTDGVVVVAASKTGYALSDAGVDAVFDRNSSLTISFETLINRIYQMINDKMNVTDADGSVALRNIGDTGNIATGSVTDDSVTTVRAELTWV